MGSPLGGVKAPEALILPDPTTRFASSAARLEALSGRPSDEGMAALHGGPRPGTACRRDHARAFRRSGTVRSRSSGRHAHAAARCGRASPRSGLARWLSRCCSPISTAETLPRRQRRRSRACAIARPARSRALADDFLNGDVTRSDAGAALYVAAALQVYFTHLAAALARSHPCGFYRSAGYVLAAARRRSRAW